MIENSAPVLGADSNISINENSTLVGNYAASDAENDTITYSLSGDDAGLFEIDAAGKLSFKVAPDYETDAGLFDVNVIATDDGEGSLFDTQAVQVSVTNVIENSAPVISNETVAVEHPIKAK